MTGERIQKLLASWGLGSRRGIEVWLRDGRVRVNGKVAGLGDRAQPGDLIELDGERVDAPGSATAAGEAPLTTAVLVYHKPVGEVTTRSDPQGRPTVFERLPPPPSGRWVAVGRLDVNTSGLLLFTTDGALAHRLMHPSFEVARQYIVRVRGQPTPATLANLRRGVQLEDGPARFDSVHALAGPQPGEERPVGSAWFKVRLHEGRNREVRRVWEAVGHEVSRLKRVAYGPLELPEDLGAGRTRLLTAEEVAGLVDALEQRAGGASS
jgi:23S rRNA pseudouridine2605 synthase